MMTTKIGISDYSKLLPITLPALGKTIRRMRVLYFIASKPEWFLHLTENNKRPIAVLIRRTKIPLNEYDPNSNSDVPYLRVDYKTGEVIGHSGRHRAAMVLVAGGRHFWIALSLVKKDEDGKYVPICINPETKTQFKPDEYPKVITSQVFDYRKIELEKLGELVPTCTVVKFEKLRQGGKHARG